MDNFEFDFERLDVYKKALNFTNKIFDITTQFKWQLQSSLGDQFRRSALSICNNLAEGSRKIGRAKIQFYSYALDSARECIPMFAISLSQRQIQEKEISVLRNDCVEITKMLYGLISSVEI